LLRRLAWYAPDDIPRSLLTTGTDVSEFDVLHAVGRLAAYNMITLDNDTISVHRLVQAVTRTPDPDDPHRWPTTIILARDTTAATLVAALTGTDHRLPTAWPVFRMVLPHARALLDHTDTDTDTDPLCALAHGLGRYLNDQGDTTTAITLLTRASQGHQRLYGPDHPDTLISRNNLAGAYRSAGDLGRAIPLYEATLTDSERVLGPDHPTTKIIRSNLDKARST
ncbi:MAG TPA: tetratricopeptide repeat protein, partial [Umezawaea sp.]|nr:tetratricopeptide repeat protein [Umezawaea sp.]